jgi:transcription antitermination factor NusG
MMPEIHRWSDRRKKVYVPLFSCYVFVNILPEAHQAVLQNPGVLGFVSFAGRPAEIPEEQMEVVRKVCKHDIPCSAYPFLTAGQRVRVREGCLAGVEGILLEQPTADNLIISVEAIQRSLAISVRGYEVEAIPSAAGNKRCS